VSKEDLIKRIDTKTKTELAKFFDNKIKLKVSEQVDILKQEMKDDLNQ
jgi:hypothetical protein